MKKLVICGFILLVSSPAWATDLVLTTDDCSYFTAHTPDEDVNFKPGVDSNGEPVTPADLNDNKIELPQKISIPIILQLNTQTQNDPPGSVKIGHLQDEAALGTLTYDTKTRQLFYQGKLISDDNHHAITEACKKMKPGKPHHTLPPAVEK